MESLVIGALLTWRLLSLLVRERGPYDLFGKLRDKVGIGFDEMSQPVARNELAQAFLCMWCLSIWVGWAVALFLAPSEWVIMGLVYSAGALIVERIAHG
jgi:hypothetical protein